MVIQIKERIKKNKIVMLLLLIFIPSFIIIGSSFLLNKSETRKNEENTYSLLPNVQCTVLDVVEDYMFVSPALNSKELDHSNCYKIKIPKDLKNVEIGNIVSITYDGKLNESYPSEFEKIKKIDVVYKLPKSTVDSITKKMTEEQLKSIENVKKEIKKKMQK